MEPFKNYSKTIGKYIFNLDESCLTISLSNSPIDLEKSFDNSLSEFYEELKDFNLKICTISFEIFINDMDFTIIEKMLSEELTFVFNNFLISSRFYFKLPEFCKEISLYFSQKIKHENIYNICYYFKNVTKHINFENNVVFEPLFSSFLSKFCDISLFDKNLLIISPKYKLKSSYEYFLGKNRDSQGKNYYYDFNEDIVKKISDEEALKIEQSIRVDYFFAQFSKMKFNLK